MKSATVEADVRRLLSTALERGGPLTSAEIREAGMPARYARALVKATTDLTADGIDAIAKQVTSELVADLERPFGYYGLQEAKRRFGSTRAEREAQLGRQL